MRGADPGLRAGGRCAPNGLARDQDPRSRGPAEVPLGVEIAAIGRRVDFGWRALALI